jgi:thiol-disulfide isomerase/thioredoxin
LAYLNLNMPNLLVTQSGFEVLLIKILFMKILAGFLLIFFNSILCHTRGQGINTSEKKRGQTCQSTTYIYTPPKGLVLPAKMQAVILYKQNQNYYESLVTVKKLNNRYVFSFKTPDSVSVLIMGIANAALDQSTFGPVRASKKLIDNNDGQGFIIYTSKNNFHQRYAEQKDVAALIYNSARYRLKVKVHRNELIKKIEAAYKMAPKLKDDIVYLDYLTILYEEKGDAAKPKLLAYADKMCNVKNDESKWLAARHIYRVLKMDKQQDLIEEKILKAYPAGELAEQNFWRRYYAKSWDRPEEIQAFMHEYTTNFKDTSSKTKDDFYRYMISIFLSQKKWDSCKYYTQLVNNKTGLAATYDDIAWELSGKQPDNSGSDLEIAKDIAAQSLQWLEDDLKSVNPSTELALYEDLLMSRIKFTNTYALILYKLGQYDSAFIYQDNIYQQKEVGLDAGSIERYAVYAEKIKGMEYCRKLIEEKLSEGINSPAMLQQLQTIYQQAGLNQDDFSRIQKENNRLSFEKKKQAISTKFGSLKAPRFSLENLKGQTVHLSSLKGKTVVLDFWATWCGPCIASFPSMQRLINKYKEDTGVVFLFIDTWERKSPRAVKQAVVKIMNENNYSFNVLFDEKSTTVAAYKVEGIPAKFIINGKGEIVFMGQTDNLAFEIEQAKNK